MSKLLCALVSKLVVVVVFLSPREREREREMRLRGGGEGTILRNNDDEKVYLTGFVLKQFVK